MILQALSVNSEASESRTRLLGRHNDWFVPGLYKNELRRTWSMGLLSAIILFFAVPVFILLVFSSNEHAYTEYPERVYSFLSEYFSVSNPFITIFACLGGMFCAMVVTEYLFDRRKMNFVCSLPVKRHAYLVTKAAANLTWSILSWIPAVVLTFLIALLTEPMRPHLGLVLGGCFVLIGAWLCMHLYFFGLTMLACCFCGTGVMGGCMLLILGGYIPAAALSLIGLADMTLPQLDSNYYLSAEFFSAISGVFRVFYKTASAKSVWFLLGTALLGLVLCAVGVVLTVIRQSEKAGTPFAFDRIRDLVKYLLMGLASLLGGMLFEAVSSGYWTLFWMLFGCICGAVLCWMLCNTIFFKTPRMMFVGRRGLIILTVCMMVFSVGTRADILGVNEYIPSALMTRRVELDTRSVITIRDRELIRAFNEMADNGAQLYEEYGWSGVHSIPVDKYEYEDDKYDADKPSVVDIGSAVWHTRYLLPIAKNLYVEYADWAEFVGALTAHEDFADLYFEDILGELESAERFYPDETYLVRFNIHSGLKAERGMDGSCHFTAEQILEILQVWREEMRSLGGDAMQQVYIGTLNIRMDNRYYEIPLFEAYEKTYETLRDVYKREYDANYNDYSYEKTFRHANVYYRGKLVRTLNESEVNALLDAGAMTGYYSSYETPLTLIEPDYSVEISYHVRETHKYTYVTTEETYVDGKKTYVEVPETEVDYNEYEDNVNASFFYGCVPEEYRQ